MPRPDKIEAVEDIAGRFRDAEAALLTEYRGLRVGEIAEVRNALREAGSDYRVLKNTLARIAVRNVGLDELVDMLQGPTAIAFVKGDAAAAAKALDEAAKKYPVLMIKGGVLNGRIIDARQAQELASLEPREVQLAKIAMLMNQPAQRTVNALAALLRDLGSMLGQVLQTKESGEQPGAEAEAEAEPEPVAEAETEPAPEPGAEAEPAPEPEAETETETETESQSDDDDKDEEE